MQGCRCRVRLPEVVASALAVGGLLARHGAGTAMAGALGIGALLARILFSVRNDSRRTAETLEDLIELERKNVKHSPDQIVRIVRLPNGRIVFLEQGNARAGLRHIVKEHGEDFARRGIAERRYPIYLWRH